MSSLLGSSSHVTSPLYFVRYLYWIAVLGGRSTVTAHPPSVSSIYLVKKGRTAPGRVVRGRHEERVVDGPVHELSDGAGEIQILYVVAAGQHSACIGGGKRRRDAPPYVVLYSTSNVTETVSELPVEFVPVSSLQYDALYALVGSRICRVAHQRPAPAPHIHRQTDTHDGVAATARDAHAAAALSGVRRARERVNQLRALVVSRSRGDVPSRRAACAYVAQEREQRVFRRGERVAAHQREGHLR